MRRRRRWLYALSLLALATVVTVAATRMLTADEDPIVARERAVEAQRSTVVERVKLTAAKGERGRGIGELVRTGRGEQRLRILAIGLRRARGDELYQALLAGRTGEPKLLGSVVVGEDETFVGQAKVKAEEFHGFGRIEIRRVVEDGSVDELVLRGRIPR